MGLAPENLRESAAHRARRIETKRAAGEIAMATRLQKPLKREIMVKRQPYIVTLSPDGLKVTKKGLRKGQELKWTDFVSGQAALAVALNASLARAR